MRSPIAAAVVAMAALLLAAPVADAHRRIPKLSYASAERRAHGYAWNIPVPADSPSFSWDSTKTTWCNTWSAWRVDCGVEADATFGFTDPYGMTPTDTWCQQTVVVLKSSRTGRIAVYPEDDLSCLVS